MSAVVWVEALGEFVIAAVIFLEIEETRRDRFLAEAADIGSYENRGRIYSAFYETAGQCVKDKAKAFCERIRKHENHDDIELRKCCEQQIVLFNRLGQIHRRAWIYKGDYVELFPHAVVLFWIMVEPYIEERRAMTGEWWAKDFRQLTKSCLQCLFESDPQARLPVRSERAATEDFVISTEYLRDLEKRLEGQLTANRGR